MEWPDSEEGPKHEGETIPVDGVFLLVGSVGIEMSKSTTHVRSRPHLPENLRKGSKTIKSENGLQQ
jgi:hypothetical protein